MMEEQGHQPVEQAGLPGKAAEVGTEVGGVRSSKDEGGVDLLAISPEGRALLKALSRDSARSHASQRGKGEGDGSGQTEIITPDKIRKLQRALYRKAKAEPKYRFWSLYGDIIRPDVLEQALRVVSSNGGAPGVDGQTIAGIKESAEGRQRWLGQLQEELKNHTYRPQPVRRVMIPKSNGGQRPLGIPTVKDRVVQMAATLVLMPIFEADFHPRSYGFRPRRNAHQAIDEIVRALRSGRREVLDADLSKYFDTIPHRQLLQRVARRVSDGSVLRLIKQWLRAPVVEEDKAGKRRVVPNRCGTPQGGVISPLLANLYLNGLDWEINERKGKAAVMVRYADDFVILSPQGRTEGLRQWLRSWLAEQGLKLNEEKTRVVEAREGFAFLGFQVRWQPARRSGREYAHVEPARKSQAGLRDKVRAILNHWTRHEHTEEIIRRVNRLLRGWSGYFHYQNSSRVFGKMRWWVNDRLRRWLWRKHACRRALWKHYGDPVLYQRYGLWALPLRAGWTTMT
jgi:group II intron reverse transcriptase/maturase